MRLRVFISVQVALLFLFVGSVDAKGQGVVAADSLPTHLYEYLVNSSSKHFHDPSIPRFLIKDRSYNFILGVGGYVQALALYDLVGMDDISFVVSSLPNEKSTGESLFKNTDVMNFDMGMSRIFFKLIGVTRKGYINAYIETDFYNSGNFLRLRQAYVEFMGLTVGQTWSIFRGEESPTTLDVQGAPSLSNRRMPLVSYTLKLSKRENLRLKVALEFPSSTTISVPDGKDGGFSVLEVAQNIPDIPVSIHWDRERFYLFAATNLRLMKYPVSDGKYKKSFSFGTHASVRYTFVKSSESNHNLFLQGIYTNGMVDCIGDLSGLGMNMVISPELDKLSINSAFGTSAAYHFRWNKNQINAIYSMVQVYGDMLKMENGLYKRGQYVALNYLREIFTHGIFGVEAIYGEKMLQSNKKTQDLRFNVLLRYDF